jgi:hypothetical protein
MKGEELWDEPEQDISAMTAVYWQISRLENSCQKLKRKCCGETEEVADFSANEPEDGKGENKG